MKLPYDKTYQDRTHKFTAHPLLMTSKLCYRCI